MFSQFLFAGWGEESMMKTRSGTPEWSKNETLTAVHFQHDNNETAPQRDLGKSWGGSLMHIATNSALY